MKTILKNFMAITSKSNWLNRMLLGDFSIMLKPWGDVMEETEQNRNELAKEYNNIKCEYKNCLRNINIERRSAIIDTLLLNQQYRANMSCQFAGLLTGLCSLGVAAVAVVIAASQWQGSSQTFSYLFSFLVGVISALVIVSYIAIRWGCIKECENIGKTIGIINLEKCIIDDIIKVGKRRKRNRRY